ncbi:hypothetical protein [Nocardia salmonicida]|uniref:hypothetical protein n=1 Tax=Nocardia salmonicida TaxID=53431 RepID=UPI0033DD1BD8
MPNENAVIDLLSAAGESLFVARRLLRNLVGDEYAMSSEALVHAARMRTLLDIHEVDDKGVSSPELVDKIARFLMLRDGKLIDDFSPVDEQIRAWVTRLADPTAMAAEREIQLNEIQTMQNGTPKLDDNGIARSFIGALLEQDQDISVAKAAAAVIETGYLDRSPRDEFVTATSGFE